MKIYSSLHTNPVTYFGTRSLLVALTGLKFMRSACLCLLNSGTKVEHHHTRQGNINTFVNYKEIKSLPEDIATQIKKNNQIQALFANPIHLGKSLPSRTTVRPYVTQRGCRLRLRRGRFKLKARIERA